MRFIQIDPAAMWHLNLRPPKAHQFEADLEPGANRRISNLPGSDLNNRTVTADSR